MITVPREFGPLIQVEYPPENKRLFEEWLAYQPLQKTEREYLPIQWTAYYVNNRYGQDRKSIYDLQTFLNNLDPNKKYWTVIQYDDSILNKVDHLDILRFEMSKNIGYPIPLLCMPHSYKHDGEKKYLASFVGSRTHDIRRNIFGLQGLDGYYISAVNHSIDHYCQIIAQSIFVLAGRGYGLNSFRVMEAMQYGAIPVYISDEFIFPYNLDFNEYGVVIEEKDAHRIDQILKEITPEQIIRKQDKIKEIYPTHFTYEGCRDRINEYLCSLV